MHSERPTCPRPPLFQTAVGAVSWTDGLRLPPECRFWWWVAEAGASLRLRYGSGPTTPAIETLGAAGASDLHPYAGDDVYLQFQAATGTRIWILWTV